MMPGVMQPPRMYGTGPQIANPGIPNAMGQTISSAQGSSPSKIDPNQIPRPMPTSSETIFETRLGNQANLPPVRNFQRQQIFFLGLFITNA